MHPLWHLLPAFACAIPVCAVVPDVARGLRATLRSGRYAHAAAQSALAAAITAGLAVSVVPPAAWAWATWRAW